MADYPSTRVDFLDDQLATGVGRHVLPGHQGGAAQWQSVVGSHDLEALSWSAPAVGAWEANANKSARPTRDFGAVPAPTGPEIDWFEHVFVLPGRISAGVVLDLKTFTITIYSSYKSASRSLDSFTNGAGPGIILPDLPTLPETIFSQAGFDVTLEVQPVGPAFINGTLDFEFDVLTVEIPITGQRTIVFPFEPEELSETLQFATDVIPLRGGNEQRHALRHVPRSRFDVLLAVEGDERRQMEMILFDGQSRVFGLPAWHEPAVLSSAVTVDDVTVSVDSTAYASFAVGGLALIWASYDYVEALEIQSLGPTSLTFTSSFTKTFSAGARVLPVRLAFLKAGSVSGKKHPLNLQESRFVFTTSDNDVDLSDVSAWNSFNGKVLLDDPNMIKGTLAEETMKSLTVIDNASGTFEVFSEWDVSRRVHTKRFYVRTRQRLWEVRQLLHALRGRATSFYIPTFYPDLEPVAPVGSGQSTLDVANVGYAKFAQSRQPRDVIRLVKKDGTSAVRAVASAAEIDEDTEQITISGTWGIDALLADVDHVDFVEKVRLNSDDVTILYRNALGEAEIVAPVKSVLD